MATVNVNTYKASSDFDIKNTEFDLFSGSFDSSLANTFILDHSSSFMFNDDSMNDEQVLPNSLSIESLSNDLITGNDFSSLDGSFTSVANNTTYKNNVDSINGYDPTLSVQMPLKHTKVR